MLLPSLRRQSGSRPGKASTVSRAGAHMESALSVGATQRTVSLPVRPQCLFFERKQVIHMSVLRQRKVHRNNLCRGCFFLQPAQNGNPNYCGRPRDMREEYPCVRINDDKSVDWFIIVKEEEQ